MKKWSEIAEHLEANQPALDAWGKYVLSTIKEHSKKELNDPTAIQITGFRVKEINSALGKIARKGYTDPLRQMTDLVGARIVVLLSHHIDVVSKVIEANDSWDAVVDRDHKDDISRDPSRFEYQSKHYMIRTKKITNIDGIDVPEALPCEVQVRTILQHAFAEVVHDKIYKADGIVPIQAKRHCSSSMALMETADHLLCETMRTIDEVNRPTDDTLQALTAAYSGLLGGTDGLFDPKLNSYIIESLKGSISEATMPEIAVIVKENAEIPGKIRDRRTAYSPFWSQPISLLAYWYVKHHRRNAMFDWPVASFRDDIQLVYSDLGIAAPR